jgi:ribosomal protein S27AE
MIQNDDQEGLIKERVHTKLLRLCNQAQNGFVLTDFPSSAREAETLESFRGGLNAFVHVNLPDSVLVDIEESKVTCNNCGKSYYTEQIIDLEHGIRIEPFQPKHDHCGDCGSTDFREGSDPVQFEQELEQYKA